MPPVVGESDGESDALLSDEEESLSDLSDEEDFVCGACGRACTNAHYLRQHIAYGRCGKQANATSGMLHQSQRPSLPCPSCRKTFSTQFHLDSHLATHIQNSEEFSNDTVTLRLEKSSLERLVRDYRMVSNTKIDDVGPFLFRNINLIHQMFQSIENFLVKALIYLNVQYVKINQSNGEVIEMVNIIFPSKAADYVNDVEEWLQRHINCLITHIENFS